jgi:excisionase family DNA binding protein
MPDRASCALLTDDTEVTPWTPRTFLGISRIHVIRLVHNRKLPAHLIGTHRRLRVVDVLAYKTRRDARLARAEQGSRPSRGTRWRDAGAESPDLLTGRSETTDRSYVRAVNQRTREGRFTISL